MIGRLLAIPLLLASLGIPRAQAAAPCRVPADHPFAPLLAHLRDPSAPASAETRALAAEVVGSFAPRVWYHPREKFQAMEPIEFIEGSELWKSYGAGAWKVADRGKVDPSELPYVSSGHFLRYFGDPTRPHAEPPLLWRLGEGRAASVFCDVGPAKVRVLIEYWFHVAYNFSNSLGIGNHEGDWEGGGALVELDLDGGRPRHRLRSLFMSAHEAGNWYCPDELGWTDGARGDPHPELFSALGTHASYATPGRHQGPVLPDYTARGRKWDAWLNLRPLVLEPYYGFTGRWGSLTLFSFMSGPKIPSPGTKPQPRDIFPLPNVDRCVPR
jgi:hypothetical protein